MMENPEMLRRIIGHFGAKRMIGALPQDELRHALDLVSVHELAAMLGIKYHTLQSHMNRGEIPFPNIPAGAAGVLHTQGIGKHRADVALPRNSAWP